MYEKQYEEKNERNIYSAQRKKVRLSVNAPGRNVGISALDSFRSSSRSRHVSRVGSENVHVSRSAAQKVAAVLFDVARDAAVVLFAALETHASVGSVVAGCCKAARIYLIKFVDRSEGKNQSVTSSYQLIKYTNSRRIDIDRRLPTKNSSVSIFSRLPVSLVGDVDPVIGESTSDFNAVGSAQSISDAVQAVLLVVIVRVAGFELRSDDGGGLGVADCLGGNGGEEERENFHFLY